MQEQLWPYRHPEKGKSHFPTLGCHKLFPPLTKKKNQRKEKNYFTTFNDEIKRVNVFHYGLVGIADQGMSGWAGCLHPGMHALCHIYVIEFSPQCGKNIFQIFFFQYLC